jgi:serine/threonine-protein kinase
MTSAGMIFGNRYTLTERIAVGGMGEVWRASDKVLGRLVAIKLLSSALAGQRGFAQRFREEARHTAALGHANIAAVYDYGEDDGASWLVMELVDGKPLSQIIRDEAPLTPARTAAIIAQAADALHAAHTAGVIHRDVKPANILVRPDGVVKLTDFGIARAVDAAPLTRTGEVMGTAQYISPEQATGQTAGPASDLYSLGCVAHEMLTGKRTFDDGSAVATAMAHVHKPAPLLPATVPAAMANVIMACLAKEPAQRPASGRALAAALRGSPGAASYPPAGYAATTVLPGAHRTEVLGSSSAYAAAQTPPAPMAPLQPRRGPAPPPARRNPAFWLVPLLLALLAAGGYALVQSGLLNPTPTPSPSTSAPSQTTTTSATPTSLPTSVASTSAPALVNVDPAAYKNRPYQDVRLELTDLGLIVIVVPRDSTLPEGQVIEVNPGGALAKGDRVTVSYSRGPQTTTTTTTTTASTPPTGTASVPVTTKAAAPGGVAPQPAAAQGLVGPGPGSGGGAVVG